MIKAYDAGLGTNTEMGRSHVLVISPEGKIIYEYTSMDPDEHVTNTLQAVRDLAAQQGTK